MTREIAMKADELLQKIKIEKDRLSNISDWIANINRIAMYGIIPSTTTIKCSKIYPNDAELRAVLYMMKSRCETRLGNLEKEFEAL